MKESLVDEPPKYIKGITFGILSPQDIIKRAEVEIVDRDLYDLSKGRSAKQYGPLDPRMVGEYYCSEGHACTDTIFDLGYIRQVQ